MEIVVEELTAGLANPTELVRIIIRVIAATVLGAIIGWERERIGKPAGLRTHMLVSLGSALFVVSAAEAGMSIADLSRVIQGLAAGIGFIGGGAILKLPDEHQIEGLTTAAGIWLTAAVGVAVGLGRLGTALLSLVLGWLIVVGVGYLEYHRAPRHASPLDRSES
jgi:putative Mg2+ transporter-C (MgtC) family protein